MNNSSENFRFTIEDNDGHPSKRMRTEPNTELLQSPSDLLNLLATTEENPIDTYFVESGDYRVPNGYEYSNSEHINWQVVDTNLPVANISDYLSGKHEITISSTIQNTNQTTLSNMQAEITSKERYYDSTALPIQEILQLKKEINSLLHLKSKINDLPLKKVSVTILNEYSYVVMEKGIKNEKSFIKFKDAHNNYPIIIQVIKDMNEPIVIQMKLHDLDEKKSFDIESEISVPRDIKNFSKEIDDIFLPSKDYKANKNLHQLWFLYNGETVCVSKPFGIITNSKQRPEIFKKLTSYELFANQSQISWERLFNELQIMFIIGTAQSFHENSSITLQKPKSPEDVHKIREVIKEISKKTRKKKIVLQRYLSIQEVQYIVTLVKQEFQESRDLKFTAPYFSKSKFDKFWDYFGEIIELLRKNSPINKEIRTAFCSHLIYGWCRNEEEENLFKGIPVGGFILRFSASNPGHISVWIKGNGTKNSHKLLTPGYLEKNMLIQSVIEDKKNWGFHCVVMHEGTFIDKREYIPLCSASLVQEKPEEKNNSNSRYEEVVDY